MIASYYPSSSFDIRVFKLPLILCNSNLGNLLLIVAILLNDDVPILNPSGNSFKLL